MGLHPVCRLGTMRALPKLGMKRELKGSRSIIWINAMVSVS